MDRLVFHSTLTENLPYLAQCLTRPETLLVLDTIGLAIILFALTIANPSNSYAELFYRRILERRCSNPNDERNLAAIRDMHTTKRRFIVSLIAVSRFFGVSILFSIFILLYSKCHFIFYFLAFFLFALGLIGFCLSSRYILRFYMRREL